MNTEQITIARREVLDLDDPDPAVRRLALATLARAVENMFMADPEAQDCAPRITHSNWHLVARYRDA